MGYPSSYNVNWDKVKDHAYGTEEKVEAIQSSMIGETSKIGQSDDPSTIWQELSSQIISNLETLKASLDADLNSLLGNIDLPGATLEDKIKSFRDRIARAQEGLDKLLSDSTAKSIQQELINLRFQKFIQQQYPLIYDELSKISPQLIKDSKVFEDFKKSAAASLMSGLNKYGAEKASSSHRTVEGGESFLESRINISYNAEKKDPLKISFDLTKGGGVGDLGTKLIQAMKRIEGISTDLVKDDIKLIFQQKMQSVIDPSVANNLNLPGLTSNFNLTDEINQIRGILGESYWEAVFKTMGFKDVNVVGFEKADGKQLPFDIILAGFGVQVKNYRMTKKTHRIRYPAQTVTLSKLLEGLNQNIISDFMTSWGYNHTKIINEEPYEAGRAFSPIAQDFNSKVIFLLYKQVHEDLRLQNKLNLVENLSSLLDENVVQEGNVRNIIYAYKDQIITGSGLVDKIITSIKGGSQDFRIRTIPKTLQILNQPPPSMTWPTEAPPSENMSWKAYTIKYEINLTITV